MWIEYKDIILNTGELFLNVGVFVFIKVQAQVYIWGRMLDVAKSDRQRNIVALISIIIFTAGYQYSLITDSRIFLLIWDFLHWSSICSLLYVLIGFDLFIIMGKLKTIKIDKYKKEK